MISNKSKSKKKVENPVVAPHRKSYLAFCLSVALAGCAITPMPLTQVQKEASIDYDRIAMFRDQEPLEGELGIEEAMARAVKYNLDNRLKLMEEALSYGQLDLASYDMLPKLTLAAGYINRNNPLVTDSRDISTGALLLSNATAQDQRRTNVDLTATWNLLDFGVSYFQAHQQADRVLIMRERTRKTVQSLMQQVRQAYWQAVGAQVLEAQVSPLLNQVQSALDDSEKVQAEKLRPPLETLNYQKSLIDLVKQLETIRDELDQAKPRLAALMNLQPGIQFNLKVPTEFRIPTIKKSLEEMEMKALLQRPDVAEANLNERISVNEVKKAIARLFPGLEFNVGPHYDSNSYLHNSTWNEGGARVTWNLFNILSGPAQKRVAEKQVDIARSQRMALSMAVLTQVHLSYRDFLGKKRQYELAQKLFEIDSQISEQTKTGADNNAQSQLSAIRSRTSELMADYRRYQNYSALQSSYGQMMATLGVDPLPKEISNRNVAALTQAIALRFDATENQPEVSLSESNKEK